MSTITIELDNLTEKEQETVKRLAEKKNPYFVPKKGEAYYNVSGYGCIAKTQNEKFDGDDFAISIGNCFCTVAEAREAITRLQMQMKWKRLSLEAGEAENPWDGKHEHYYVYWDSADKKIDNDYHDMWKDGQIFFPSEKSLKAAIDEIGEENVKKYILGVNDGR